MPTVRINPNEPYCVIVVPLADVPLDRKFVIGKVAVSCQPNIIVGSPVGVAGGALGYVRNNQQNDNTLFIAELTTNTGKRADSDPDLFVKFVALPKSDVANVIELVENARETLKNCLDKLDKIE
jgi:hypothetical protein